jgi:hypothetical protein
MIYKFAKINHFLQGLLDRFDLYVLLLLNGSTLHNQFKNVLLFDLQKGHTFLPFSFSPDQRRPMCVHPLPLFPLFFQIMLQQIKSPYKAAYHSPSSHLAAQSTMADGTLRPSSLYTLPLSSLLHHHIQTLIH